MSAANEKRDLRVAPRASPAVVLLVAVAVWGGQASAHHPISGKFDPAQTGAFEGIVTKIDWRNPHAHVFVNVERGEDVENWAVELESPVLLEHSGWTPETLKPGDAVGVTGIFARDGTRQIWGESVVLTKTGRRVLDASGAWSGAPRAPRPIPRGPDGHPLLGAANALGGYWAYPTQTALVESGADVAMNADGLLDDLADASRVAPLQPWALGLYEHRQTRALRDDPLFVNCKPPGGVRHMQSPLGVQFAEDHERERIFVLIGGGNRNYRILYLDGRQQQGQVRGDDDNPLYYGRSVGQWEGDTLVVDTAGFNEDFWFTSGGLPHTDRLRLIERFTRVDFDTLRYEVTIDDPGAYMRPWSSTWDMRWVGGEELPEYFCQDNRP